MYPHPKSMKLNTPEKQNYVDPLFSVELSLTYTNITNGVDYFPIGNTDNIDSRIDIRTNRLY